jgi:hypothetical protein
VRSVDEFGSLSNEGLMTKSLTMSGLTYAFRFLRGRRAKHASTRKRRGKPLRLEALETRNLMSSGSDVWNFVTAPRLHPMKVSVQTQQPGTANGLTFANGDHFIGWGGDTQSNGTMTSNLSQFTDGGTMIYDVVMPGENVSYRAFDYAWVGLPLTRPAAAVRKTSGQRTVYASWNGATQDVAWELLAGPTRSALAPVSITPRNGFETVMPTASPGPFYQVKALAADGTVLGSSAVVTTRRR